MQGEPKPVYVFRSEHIAKGSLTVMCAAPLDLVVAAYGGGGHHDQQGVQRAFGGNLFYRNDETGERFLGVWGARNASRFRTALRRKAPIKIVEGEIAPELTGQGLPLAKCEAYNRVYDQHVGSR